MTRRLEGLFLAMLAIAATACMGGGTEEVRVTVEHFKKDCTVGIGIKQWCIQTLEEGGGTGSYPRIDGLDYNWGVQYDATLEVTSCPGCPDFAPSATLIELHGDTPQSAGTEFALTLIPGHQVILDEDGGLALRPRNGDVVERRLTCTDAEVCDRVREAVEADWAGETEGFLSYDFVFAHGETPDGPLTIVSAQP